MKISLKWVDIISNVYVRVEKSSRLQNETFITILTVNLKWYYGRVGQCVNYKQKPHAPSVRILMRLEIEAANTTSGRITQTEEQLQS